MNLWEEILSSSEANEKPAIHVNFALDSHSWAIC